MMTIPAVIGTPRYATLTVAAPPLSIMLLPLLNVLPGR